MGLIILMKPGTEYPSTIVRTAQKYIPRMTGWVSPEYAMAGHMHSKSVLSMP
jgi:hypothetical protein